MSFLIYNTLTKFKLFFIKYLSLVSEYLQLLKWQKFHKNNTQLTEHIKPYKKPSELVQKLIDEGVEVEDRSCVEKIIYNHNYFRLKAYFIPFRNENQKFEPYTKFNDIYKLYLADQEIRNFLFSIIAILEIRIRAVIDNEITKATNDPFWHLNPENFRSYSDIQKLLKKAEKRFRTGKQEFAIHHKNKYYTSKSFEFRFLPPFWVISEILTIEQLLTISDNISRVYFRYDGGNILNNCALEFGFTSYESLMTNLKCILAIRNISAHHSRIWNRNLQAPNAINKKVHKLLKPSSNNRLYSNLVMLRIMCKQQKINDGIASFFSDLLANQSTLDKQKKSMGFPDFWETDPIWK